MKAVKIAFRGVIGGENLKILKFFIFWFFDFVDRFYTLTYASDLFAARGSGHRSRSTHFILWPKVAGILSDFPLTAYGLKCPQEWWNFSTRSKTVIGASMRDPNFWSATLGRHLALCKWRCFWSDFWSFENASETDFWHFLKVWNHEKCNPKWSQNFSKHFEIIENRLKKYWNRSESLFNVLKTVKNTAKIAKNDEKSCKNSWKALENESGRLGEWWNYARRLIRPLRTRCARSRRLNLQWIHGREILS